MCIKRKFLRAFKSDPLFGIFNFLYNAFITTNTNFYRFLGTPFIWHFHILNVCTKGCSLTDLIWFELKTYLWSPKQHTKNTSVELESQQFLENGTNEPSLSTIFLQTWLLKVPVGKPAYWMKLKATPFFSQNMNQDAKTLRLCYLQPGMNDRSSSSHA